MESAYATKSDEKKATHAAGSTPEPAALRSDAGATAGMPVFLQRSPLMQQQEEEVQIPEVSEQPEEDALQPQIQLKCEDCETEEAEEEPAAQLSPKINQPEDPYEREADAIAEQVTTISSRQELSPTPQIQLQPLAASITPLVQRQTDFVQTKCSACEAEKTEEESPTLQRKSSNADYQESEHRSPHHNLGSRLQESKGSGDHLDDSARSQMESAFGTDLSHVRVHTDDTAVQLNQDLHARAFTHQSDIYFNSGQYSPSSPDGKQLLAHELTHTIQQRGTQENLGVGQSAFIQRDTDCETTEGGSEEQAAEAETATDTGECSENNPSAEQPPEGTEEPATEETPTEVNTAEGAPVDERQANAPPPDQDAPESESGITEAGEQTEELPQDPCAVRAEAGLGETEMGTGAAAGSVAAETPLQTAVLLEDPSGSGELSLEEGQASEENSFLADALSNETTNLPSEGKDEAASPEVAAERDQVTVSAEEALASLEQTSTDTASMTRAVQFEASATEDAAVNQELQNNRQSSSSIASSFLNNAGQQLNSFIGYGTAAANTLRLNTEQKQAELQANIEQHQVNTQSLMAQLRAIAQIHAQTATQQIEAKHLETLLLIESQATAAQTEITLTYEEQVQQLEQVHTDQLDILDQVYTTGHADIIQIGHDKGRQARSQAREHEQAYREARNTPADVQDKVQNRKKDGFWDGYLTYNRYMARADAAKEVGKQQQEGFEQQATSKADHMMCGKSRDIATTQAIADQGLQSLTCGRDNALDAIEAQRQSAVSMAEQAQQKALSTVQSSLQATLKQFDEREAGQLQLLQDYGVRQELAIERDSERAVGAVLQGVNDAALNILQYLSQFREQVENAEAPAPKDFPVQLAPAEAQLFSSFIGAHASLDQALNQAQTSLEAAQDQALGALTQVYQGGADDALLLSDSFEQATQDLVTGTMTGYDQILTTFDDGIEAELDNSTAVLEGVVSGTIGVFEQISTGVEGTFQEVATQMEQGMQQSLDEDLDHKICVQAEKAAADVHPWWKTALKVLLIIVVIVVVAIVLGPAIIGAVGAAATALAGSLGAGAALAGTIGAWLGPIVGGAIVGAIAGATIQVGSNAIYGKQWDEGLKEAVIAGAIGGALGGLGGQFAQILVGRFASTAFSRFAMQFGTEGAFDVVGGILGDLAAGNPITLEGVILGLAIGGAVQISMGGLGGLASRSRPARTGTQAAGADSFVTRLAQGKLGRAAERITDFQGRAMGLGERVGAMAGGVGSKAPSVDATRSAIADARLRTERGEVFPIRGGQEPDNWRPRQMDAESNRPENSEASRSEPTTESTSAMEGPPKGRATHVDEPEIEPGVVAIGKAHDGHDIKVLQDGRIVRCSDCATVRTEYAAELADPKNRAIRDQLDSIESDPSLSPAEKIKLATDLEQQLANVRRQTTQLAESNRRFENFRRSVDPKDIKGAPAVEGGGTTGHARSKHGVSTSEQATILNNPEIIFSGRNKNGRDVDIYYKDGSVVITVAGDKTSVITSYGAIAKKGGSSPLTPDKWAGDPSYVEVRINSSNEVIYPNETRFRLGDWPHID